METKSIIQGITQGVNIWEGVGQGINRFGKRLIEALLREGLLSCLGRRRIGGLQDFLIGGKPQSPGWWPTSCRI